MTVKQIREYFKSLETEEIPSAIEKHHLDARIGVRKICETYEKKYKKTLKEELRVQAMAEFDNVFKKNQETILVGIDEAGRGPLAGPVVAAAVILPYNIVIDNINDSKKLTQSQREELYKIIMEKAIQVEVGIVDAQTIDKINILRATFKAMEVAVEGLGGNSGVILVDGNQTLPGLPSSYEQHTVVKGDAKSASIAAAGIIAKVTRDKMMVEYDAMYPEYKLSSHKGYGSLEHQDLIKKHGPSPIHRMSFLKNIL